MMKSICVLARRADIDRAEFQLYYEENHAPLGIRHFPFSRYVRNHLIDAPDIGFDTISEFWAEDIGRLAGLMDGPVGEIMSADERRFMDQSRIAPAGSDEHVLSEGAKTDGDGRRSAVLVDWEGDDASGRAALLEWGRSIAGERSGVSIDFTQSWREPAFPARAVLWTHGTPPPAPPSLQVTVLQVRRVETPASDLLRDAA